MARSATAPARSLSAIGLAAIRYGEGGWPVFPVKAGGKTPLTEHGFKDARTDATALQEWWDEWPDANIGLAVPEGFVVVDIDSPEALNELKARDFDLPATLTVQTARGWHHYYRTEADIPQAKLELLPGVETRVAGKGYVVAPPSVHETGAEYELIVGDFSHPDSIAPAPSWLEEMFSSGFERFDLETALRGFDQGERNDQLWRMTGALRCRDYQKEETLELLLEAAGNCRPKYAEVGQVESMVERCYSSEPPLPSFHSDCSDLIESLPEPDPGLPLEAFLDQAKTCSKASKTHTRTFDFARRVFGHPEWVRISEPEQRDLVAARWGEEAMWRIMAELKKVAVPHGANPLEIAFELASERPIYEDPNLLIYSLFLNFCYYLSDTLRGQDIGLACDRVGALIGCDGKTVWHMRNEAKKTGVITETKAGVTGKNARFRRATRFRFNLDVFNSLNDTRNEVEK